MEIDQTLETMNEEWERLSEKFRYQNGMFYLYDIVENFLAARGDLNEDYGSEQSESANDNEKYIQMNNLGTMEVVQEEESPQETRGHPLVSKLDLNASGSHQSPSFLENGNLQIMSPEQVHHYSPKTSHEEYVNNSKLDAMTFGNQSTRIVNAQGDELRPVGSFDPLNSIDKGVIRASDLNKLSIPGGTIHEEIVQKKIYSNSFGTSSNETAQKVMIQNYAHESMDTNRARNLNQTLESSNLVMAPQIPSKLNLKSTKEKLSRQSSKKRLSRSKSPLLRVYKDSADLHQSMNLNNNVPINTRGSQSKPHVRSILKNTSNGSFNLSNNSTQKKFFVNNLTNENFNVYERGSINSSETVPINQLNKINSSSNLNAYQNGSRRVVQQSGTKGLRVSKSPVLTIVGDARGSHVSDTKPVNVTQNVYTRSNQARVSPRMVINNVSNQNLGLRNSQESGLASNYTSIQSNNHVHLQSLNHPSIEIEYNNYHPGTNYSSIPYQSQNLAKLVPQVREYGSPNVKKLNHSSSKTQLINPEPLNQPFNPPKRLIHHAHKQPISQLFKCTPIILPENDVGLNQIVAKSNDRILGASIQGDIIDYAFHLNQGESCNIKSINGRDDEDEIQAFGQVQISTLDHIKDMIIDSEGRVIFTQLLSGVFISARNADDGNQYIGPCCQNMLPGRSVIYAREFEELIVVSSNSRVESYSQNEEYKRSNYLAIDIPPGSGDIKHVIPGRVNKTKAFILTDEGHIVHIGSDDGIAHIQFQANTSKHLIYPLA